LVVRFSEVQRAERRIANPASVAFVGNPTSPLAFLESREECMEEIMGRGILLWLLGVPIPVIILLWLFFGR
jgi:hypothetical protein